jgi:hypothetical protein
MLDIEEKISDATTDKYMTIKTTGTKSFDPVYFQASVTQVSDSVFLRAEHNWVPPDSLKNPVPGLFLSDYRYWKIDGTFPSSFLAKGRFYYNKTTSGTNSYLDNTFITNSVDSLVLLYRKTPGQDWQFIPFSKSGGTTFGYLITDTLRPGEYCMGIWNWALYLGIQNHKNPHHSPLSIYPNPSDSGFTIEYSVAQNGMILVYDVHGTIVYKINAEAGEKSVYWAPQSSIKGIYIIELLENGSRKEAKKVVLY